MLREVRRVVIALKSRNDEMKVHGLAITHYQLCIFTRQKHGRSFENLERRSQRSSICFMLYEVAPSIIDS